MLSNLYVRHYGIAVMIYSGGASGFSTIHHPKSRLDMFAVAAYQTLTDHGLFLHVSEKSVGTNQIINTLRIPSKCT